jgi:chaperonin cofactor prefoldin
MSHRRLRFLAAVLFMAGAATAARTQSSSSGAAAPAAGQTAAANGSVATPAPAAGKKVWTNDDVTDLRSESMISTVGSSSAKPSDKPATAAKNKDAKPYQVQIARLEAQIPPIDSQIAELQAAIDGKPTGDAKTSQRPRGVKADDWSAELQELQTKRDGIEAQITDLRDQARHHGIPANTLP